MIARTLGPLPIATLAWSWSKAVPKPYAWDYACSRCLTLLCRAEYWDPVWADNHWVRVPVFRRLVLPPEVSYSLGRSADTKLPRFGLRSRAEHHRGSASRSARGRGWLVVNRGAHIRCPSGCPVEYLVPYEIMYGAPRLDPREPWPWWIDPVSGDRLACADPDSLFALRERRQGPLGVPGRVVAPLR